MSGSASPPAKPNGIVPGADSLVIRPQASYVIASTTAPLLVLITRRGLPAASVTTRYGGAAALDDGEVAELVVAELHHDRPAAIGLGDDLAGRVVQVPGDELAADLPADPPRRRRRPGR